MNRILLFISTLLIALTSCAQQKNQDLGSYFEALANNKKFNGNVLIIKGSSVVLQKSLGFARGDKNQELTAEHLFQVGSIYKEFPAVSIMQLKEKGLLTLGDKLSLHVSGLPSWSEKVTIRHLLQYSSGLPQVDWNSLFGGGGKVNIASVLNQVSSISELTFEPGSDYVYSNYNPFLLIRVVEKISGLEFGEYLERNLFEEHNLEGIVLTSRYPYVDGLNREFAYPFDEEYQEDGMEYDLPSICASAKGIARWFEVLDYFEIISKESLKELSEEAIKGDNIQSPLGRGDWKDDELELHLHHGSTGNYESLVRHYKKDRVTVVLLTNQKHRNLHDIADDVYRMVR